MTEFVPIGSFEAVNEFMQRVSTTFNEDVQQLAAIVRPGLIAAGKVIQEFISDLDAQWPGWREFAANVGDYVPEPEPEGCHCLCAVAHGGLGVCVGEAEPDLLFIGSLDGEQVNIPVCRACFEAKALVAA